ncbi:MAG: LapA family protein [Alphaproteobacteria bacterium]|nr:LapA family protein [Alphaproteobacteria bacterium]
MRLVYLVAFVVFTIFCIVVAVANRTVVAFSFHPLPFVIDLPLYLVLFAGIFIGLGAGVVAGVAKSLKHARHTREQTRKIRDLENQLKASVPPEVL